APSAAVAFVRPDPGVQWRTSQFTSLKVIRPPTYSNPSVHGRAAAGVGEPAKRAVRKAATMAKRRKRRISILAQPTAGLAGNGARCRVSSNSLLLPPQNVTRIFSFCVCHARPPQRIHRSRRVSAFAGREVGVGEMTFRDPSSDHLGHAERLSRAANVG